MVWLCVTHTQGIGATMTEQLTSEEGLSGLLRAVAGRIESDINGLNKTLLEQSADKLDMLEEVADVAVKIIDAVPTAKPSEKRVAVKVDYRLLVELMRRLEEAGRRVKVLRV